MTLPETKPRILHSKLIPTTVKPGMVAVRAKHRVRRIHHDFEDIDTIANFAIKNINSMSPAKIEGRVIDAISSIKGEVTTRDRTISLYERHSLSFYI